jgi:ectoine hydroxylase-related dioxygenase (phytanoyl-CoA dioxygenase family)
MIKRYPEKKNKIKATSVNCNVGDAIVLNSSVWHGSGEKNTPGERTIITLAYTRWFISQQFAIPYSIKNKNKFTEKQKYPLGFYNYPPKNEKQRQTRRGSLPRY